MGLLEVDSASGRVKRSLRGAEMFLPGSSAKLFSVSAVWKILGPDTRFTTPVYILGSRKGERVEGDLVLVGSGDLTLGGYGPNPTGRSIGRTPITATPMPFQAPH